MSTVNNQASTYNASASNKSGQKNVEQGTWMFYDQAVAATGKSEKTLKRYVKKGELTHRRMGKQINSPVQVFITPAFIASVGGELEQPIEDPDIFDLDAQDVDLEPEIGQQTAHPDSSTSAASDVPYDRVIKLMVQEFTVQLDRQKEVLFELRQELNQKEAQLRLLPDLQKQLEEKEKEAHIKSSALEKQIEALQTDRESQTKILEQLQIEQESRAKAIEELRTENEKLRAQADSAKEKKSWWNWFVGRS